MTVNKELPILEWDYGNEFDWDCLITDLRHTLEKYENEDKPGLWYVTVKGFGWRNLDGYQHLALPGKSSDGQLFLSKILPNAGCTFQIYEYNHGDQIGLKIHNFHHDSPTGEWYYAIPVKREWFCDFCGIITPDEPMKVTKQSLEFSDGERCCEECADIRGYKLVRQE